MLISIKEENILRELIRENYLIDTYLAKRYTGGSIKKLNETVLRLRKRGYNINRNKYKLKLREIIGIGFIFII